MRSTTISTPTAIQRVVQAAILAGAVAIGAVLVDQSIERIDDRARGERLCLIESMLAVKDALAGGAVPADLPPACAELDRLLDVVTTTVPPPPSTP